MGGTSLSMMHVDPELLKLLGECFWEKTAIKYTKVKAKYCKSRKSEIKQHSCRKVEQADSICKIGNSLQSHDQIKENI